MKSEQRKFNIEFLDSDGVKSIWKYDFDITTSGPISTEQILSKDQVILAEDAPEVANDSLPMSKRKFWNAESGKWVGYTRAYNLGLLPKK